MERRRRHRREVHLVEERKTREGRVGEDATTSSWLLLSPDLPLLPHLLFFLQSIPLTTLSPSLPPLSFRPLILPSQVAFAFPFLRSLVSPFTSSFNAAVPPPLPQSHLASLPTHLVCHFLFFPISRLLPRSFSFLPPSPSPHRTYRRSVAAA